MSTIIQKLYWINRPITICRKWRSFTQEVCKFSKFKNNNKRGHQVQARKTVEAKKELNLKRTYKNKSQKKRL